MGTTRKHVSTETICQDSRSRVKLFLLQKIKTEQSEGSQETQIMDVYRP